MTTPTGPSGPTSDPQSHSDSERNFEISRLDIRKAKDNKEFEEMQAQIDAWVKRIQEEASVLLAKHGIEKFSLGFHHPGSGELIILNKGSLLETTVIARDVYVALKNQVDKLTGA